MSTIGTSTAPTASAFSNQRKIDRCQNGVLWAAYWDGTANTASSIQFEYSTDDGQTWTDSGTHFGFGVTNGTLLPSLSLFIDLDDFAHVVYRRRDGDVMYRRGTPNAGRTAWTWSNETLVAEDRGLSNNVYRVDIPDIVVHREGTGWAAHVICELFFALSGSWTPQVHYRKVSISNVGVITLTTGITLGTGQANNAAPMSPSIDFNHTGDGKTVAGGTPHLYTTWQTGATGAGQGVRFRKSTYAGGSWTWGTEREITSSSFANAGCMSSIFDGEKCLIAFAPSDQPSAVTMYSRDAADTATIWYGNQTPTDGTITGISVTCDTYRNVHLWAIGATSADIWRIKYGRLADAWTAWEKFATATATPGSLSVTRGGSTKAINAMWTDGAASPYNVTHGSLKLGSPVRVYNGTTWVDHTVRIYNGTTWGDYRTRIYNGTAWVDH